LGLKVVRLIILLIIVAIISFVLVDLSPIDPVQMYVGDISKNPEQTAKLEAYWGVHEPITTKIGNWLHNILVGNLGNSLIYMVPVIDVITEKFSASLVLMFLSWLISGVLGFLLGVVAGTYQGKWIDKIIKVYDYVLLSAPPFWIALVLLMVFSVALGWFPIGLGVPIGVVKCDVTIFEWIHRLILPIIALSVTGIAQIAIFTRDKLISTSTSDFFTFAKARGESGWELTKRHGIRNVLLPAITLQFLSFSELFGGTILVEQVFSYPGIGQAAVAAGIRSDVPLLLGIVIFSTIFVFVGNTLADLLYKFIDPRIRESES
jgi:peptide/nickel transport system permease protein